MITLKDLNHSRHYKGAKIKSYRTDKKTSGETAKRKEVI